MTKVVALLPMKANSSRVPGKNFRNFCGKPLFRWVLDSLLEVSDIQEIIINTDAEDILRDHGLFDCERITIRQRPTEICGDDVSMNLVIADDLKNVTADVYLMTHTTNPLLSSNSIELALKRFMTEKSKGTADSLFTVNKIQTRFYRGDGTAINHDPENLIPTQDLEPWYEENSNLYIFSSESFAKTNARIGLKPTMHVTPRKESVDIDTPEDWEMAVASTQALLRSSLLEG